MIDVNLKVLGEENKWHGLELKTLPRVGEYVQIRAGEEFRVAAVLHIGKDRGATVFARRIDLKQTMRDLENENG